jgi:hypothetical protein
LTDDEKKGRARDELHVLIPNPSLLSPDESLAVIQSVSEQFADSDDLSEVLATVAEVVRTSLRASAITVGVIRADRSVLVTLLALGFSAKSEEMLSKPCRLAAGCRRRTPFATVSPSSGPP